MYSLLYYGNIVMYKVTMIYLTYGLNMQHDEIMRFMVV